MVEFEWDEVKRLSYLEKHELDFLAARRLFDGRPLFTTTNLHHDELRSVSTGVNEYRHYTLIWTERSDSDRVISMRRARDAEKRKYRAVHG